MDKIPDRIDSKFRYVLLAAARAEQMINGSSMKPDDKGQKVTRVSMDEIKADAVEWDYGPAPEPTIEGGIDETNVADEVGESKE